MKPIHLLYEQALLEVRAARAATAAGEAADRSKRLTNALAIIRDLDEGAGRPANLAILYQYMQRRLTEGLISLREEPIAEVESLIGTLHEGWTAMAHPRRSSASVPIYAEISPR